MSLAVRSVPFLPPVPLLALFLYLSSYLLRSVRLCATPSDPLAPLALVLPLTCRGNSRDPSRAAIPGSLLAVARRVLFHFQ